MFPRNNQTQKQTKIIVVRKEAKSDAYMKKIVCKFYRERALTQLKHKFLIKS